MEAFAERARRKLLATAEKARKRSPDRRGELTPQEEQIARLARGGLSNPEIGAQLFVSARTIEWHLRNVFAKLARRTAQIGRMGCMPTTTTPQARFRTIDGVQIRYAHSGSSQKPTVVLTSPVAGERLRVRVDLRAAASGHRTSRGTQGSAPDALVIRVSAAASSAHGLRPLAGWMFWLTWKVLSGS
jgi:hypothetical protein